jgi:site-specific recombinase
MLDRNIGGIAGNLAIGFLLGFTPFAFAFMGLGLESRHVTLVSASLGLALARQIGDQQVDGVALAWAALGIVTVAILNFGVSFVLALRLAERARGLDAEQRKAVWKAVWQSFRSSPGRFLWLPRKKVAPGANGEAA